MFPLDEQSGALMKSMLQVGKIERVQVEHSYDTRAQAKVVP